MIKALIFDFDGVIADSEVVANAVLARFVTELGVPTTLEQSYERFMGKRFEDVVAAVEQALGKPLQAEFSGQLQARTFDSLRSELKPVPGALDYLSEFVGVKSCIASSSSPARLALCLDVLGLTERFPGTVFSASMVSRGKPYPDIFLHAARQIGVPAEACLVLEDSVSGVQAAKAAGMAVLGVLAASHIQPEHGARLAAAGADCVAPDFAAAARATRAMLATV